MNVLEIENQLKLLNTLGYTLNIQERINLKIAHIQLMNQYPDIDELKFWGKVEGLAKSYYLFMGLRFRNSYQFPHKSFLWASEDFNFKELPELLLQHEDHAEKSNGFFHGDPAKIVVNLEGDGEEGEAPPENAEEGEQGALKPEIDEDEEELKKIPKKNFTELNRLSHVVRAIQNDCQIVPQGGFRVTTQNQLRPNNYFYGLTKNNALSHESWLHFRSPQTKEGRAKIQGQNVVFSTDFLDNLSQDLPRGVWSLQLTSDANNVSVRNLGWPGYYAFHKLNSNIFGSVYIGDGIKNVDLPFML